MIMHYVVNKIQFRHNPTCKKIKRFKPIVCMDSRKNNRQKIMIDMTIDSGLNVFNCCATDMSSTACLGLYVNAMMSNVILNTVSYEPKRNKILFRGFLLFFVGMITNIMGGIFNTVDCVSFFKYIIIMASGMGILSNGRYYMVKYLENVYSFNIYHSFLLRVFNNCLGNMQNMMCYNIFLIFNNF